MHKKTLATEFTNLLIKHKVDSNTDYTKGTAPYTHQSVNPEFGGKYMISQANMEKFWTCYCDNIINENYEFTIAEKCGANIPVLVDLDLSIPYTGDDDDDNPVLEHLYTTEDIKEIVEIYYTVFAEIIDKWHKGLNRNYCCVMEKKPYLKMVNNGKRISSGLHLSFPYVWLEKHHHVQLLNRVRAKLSKKQLFLHLGIKDSGKLIDGGYITTPWLLYGSKKTSTSEPYLLSYILNAECEVVSMEEAFQHYVIYDSDENPINLKDNYAYYLPRILSTDLWSRRLLKPLYETIMSKVQVDQTTVRREQLISQHSHSEAVKQARMLMELINSSRATNYNEWMDIGWTLFNIDSGEAGYQMWLKFSEQSTEKFDEAKCHMLWEKMEKSNKSIGSLKFYAQQDNLEKYKQLLGKFANDDLQEAIGGSHNHLAKALKIYFGHEWKCTMYQENQWYFFENHHWRKCPSAVYLRQKLSDDFPTFIKAKIHELQDELPALREDNTRDTSVAQATINDKIKKFVELKSKLGDSTFKSKIMTEAKEVFYDETFAKKLNTNVDLICFKNGVYDFNEDMGHRAGTPEDYISLQLPVEYKPFNGTEPEVLAVYDFFEKLFPDEELRHYMKCRLSEVISKGGNFRKHIYIWKGVGHNGKSVLQSFMDQLLGDYAVKLPTALVVGKRTQSSSCSPELIRAGSGVRLTTIMEPSKSEKFNIGILKELTGNDNIYARGLYQDGIDLVPQFKLNIICNNVPKIVDGDTAIWNRMRVIPFESVFVEEGAPETREEQMRLKIFPMDNTFSSKIPSMLQAFLWVLIDTFQKNKNSYSEPESVIKHTAIYKKRNDVYNQFCEDKLTKVIGETIPWSQLLVHYQTWFKNSSGYDPKDIGTQGDIQEEFINRYGEMDAKKRFKNIAFQQDEDVSDTLPRTD